MPDTRRPTSNSRKMAWHYEWAFDTRRDAFSLEAVPTIQNSDVWTMVSLIETVQSYGWKIPRRSPVWRILKHLIAESKKAQ
jgi:hypothetical protein